MSKKLDEILLEYHYPITGEFDYEPAKQAIQALIDDEVTKAKMQVIRDIKNSEGYGKMPVGMRDLLSDMSQYLNAQLRKAKR